MFAKPREKPVVLGVLNPLANGRLTIKQNKTKQEGVGLVLKTKPNPLTCLSVNLTSKVLFLASSFASTSETLESATLTRCFQHVFHRVFHIAHLEVISGAIRDVSRARRDTTMPNLRQGATNRLVRSKPSGTRIVLALP